MSLLDLYHRLPYPGRCLAAGLRGGYLRWWRYGRQSPRLVEEALGREHWTQEEWRRFHDQALANLNGVRVRVVVPAETANSKM